MTNIKSYWHSLSILFRLFFILSINYLSNTVQPGGLLKEVKNRLLIRFTKHQWLGYAIALIVLALAIPKFNQFGGLRFEQMLFFLVLPFTLTKKGGFYKPIPSFIMATFFILTFYLTHVYSLFYFGLCCAIFTSLTITKHRPTLLSFGLGLITTPAIKYLLSIFSFPLRLEITEVAGQILSLFMQELKIAGNCIIVNGISFTVAPECLGLNMISSALVFAVFVLAFFAKKFQKRPQLGFTLLFMSVAFTLVVLTNLTRILLTVILQAMPGNTLHELIGIFLFVINCCLPLFVIGAYSKRFYRTHNTNTTLAKQKYTLSLFLLPILVIGSYSVHKNLLNTEFYSTSVSINGFNKSESKDGVSKFINASAIIYVKPPAFMLGSDHNPFICWRGSGYQIKNERLQQMGKHSVYTFELHKPGAAPLYSCWWYSNGQTNSISQLEWRLATLNGKAPFVLVNVTTGNKNDTHTLSTQLLQTNIFD